MQESVASIQKNGYSTHIRQIVKKIHQSAYPVSIRPAPKPTTLCVNGLSDILDDSPQYKTIQILSAKCNDTSLQKWELGIYPDLVSLYVGNSCLRYLTCLRLRGFQQLETVGIGSNCSLSGRGGVFEMSDCPRLKTLKVGNYSFSRWTQFCVKNCPLKELVLGDYCFCECTLAVFQSMG